MCPRCWNQHPAFSFSSPKTSLICSKQAKLKSNWDRWLDEATLYPWQKVELGEEKNRLLGQWGWILCDIRGYSRRFPRGWGDLGKKSLPSRSPSPLPVSVRADQFFEPPGMWDADCLLGPPKRNLGLKSRRNGRMDQSQVPRLPRTTSAAFESFVPLFVPVILNYEL